MTSLSSGTQVEKRSDLSKGKSDNLGGRLALQWKQEIERAIKSSEKYIKNVDKIIARYRVEMGKSQITAPRRRYNVLWSMVQTLQPNLFMGMPKPYVSRRYRDKDPVARTASQIIERCLAYVNDSDEMHDAIGAAVDDYILAARGTIWTRYSPEFDLRQSEVRNYYDVSDDDFELPKGAKAEIDEDGRHFYTEQFEALTNEECETDHIQVVNFLHPPASSWKSLPWVAKRVLMTRAELVERFGEEIGNRVPLNCRADGSKAETKNSEPKESDGIFLLAAVWEVWDRPTKKVYWVCLECDYILDVKDDPLGLKGFFPCPKPLYGTTTNNTLLPVPDFKYYESVAMELDDITQRISLLTEALRVVGFYNGGLGDDLSKLFDETEENEMVPVKNWAALQDGGGLKGNVEFLPIEHIIVVVDKLYAARSALVQELYEITGMSDIVRGTSDPRETAAAQKIKGQYASKRLVRRQKAVARFAREHLEIQAEIICKHYDDQTILRISGADQFVLTQEGQFDAEMFQAAIALLRDNPLRHFRIKIDNETLAGDEAQQSKEQGVEFLTSISQMIGTVTPLAQQNPQLASVMKELVLFGVRLFPIARSVEGHIESTLEDLAKNIQPPPQEEKPKDLSPDQKFQLEMKRLELQERELGLRTKELALKEWETRWTVALNSKRIENDAGNRGEAISSQERIADKQIDQKDRAERLKARVELEKQDIGAAQKDADREQRDAHKGLDIVDAARDRAQASKAHSEKHAHQVEKDALEISERRIDRDVQQDNQREANELARESLKSRSDKEEGDAR